tara:strand:+ start:1264 stop:1737 length:474 start_codon:yes stop_codon:yes gene_type:complete
MITKHLLDSLTVSPYLKGSDILDVGTGAGFPGIPLAIINPHKNFTLLDSSQKRIAFIKEAKRKLALTNVSAVHSRVEHFSGTRFTSISSRAFSSLDKMLSQTDHLIDNEGVWLAMKGVYPSDEIGRLADKYCLEESVPLCVPDLIAERYLLIIKHKG